ncbi:hypothetical protein Tco_1051601 [Tanacetum coccineum]
MPTEMELTLEQTQQGVSYEVLVDPHRFEGYLKMEVKEIGYGVSDLLDTAYRTYSVRRIELLRYGVLGSLGTTYWLFGYGVLSYSGTVYCISWVRRIELLGYGVLAESVLFLIFDQSIIYDVYTDVDTAYSSKSGNGLLIRQSLGYVV